MKPILPDRATAIKKGWTHQVQWMEQGKPCFTRCCSEEEAESLTLRLFPLDAMILFPLDAMIIDLNEAFKLH